MKKKWIFIASIMTLIVIIGGFSLYKYMEYRRSNTFKLLEIGYTKEETKQIQDKIKNIDHIITLKYQKQLPILIKEKYFIEKYIDRYIDYQKKEPKQDITNIIAIVNVNQDLKNYEKSKNTDIQKKEQMLVNKYYSLKEDYTPVLTDISSKYAYAGNKISENIYENFKSMCKAANEEHIRLVASLGYRDYQTQKKTYESYVDSKGTKNADAYVARPGYSEHQTGLALDILAIGVNRNNFENSDAFKWLSKHSQEYGFILRYPKGKEYLTGFNYEPWHYRYVGKDIAQRMKKENITFDEYYAFYLE